MNLKETVAFFALSAAILSIPPELASQPVRSHSTLEEIQRDPHFSSASMTLIVGKPRTITLWWQMQPQFFTDGNGILTEMRIRPVYPTMIDYRLRKTVYEDIIDTRIHSYPGLPAYDDLSKQDYIFDDDLPYGLVAYKKQSCKRHTPPQRTFVYQPKVGLNEFFEFCGTAVGVDFLAPPLEDGRGAKILCSRKCTVTTDYLGFRLVYQFSVRWLSEWRIIDKKIRDILDLHSIVKTESAYPEPNVVSLRTQPESQIIRDSELVRKGVVVKKGDQKYLTEFLIPKDYLIPSSMAIFNRSSGNSPWIFLGVVLPHLYPRIGVEKDDFLRKTSLPIREGDITIRISTGIQPKHPRFQHLSATMRIRDDFFGLKMYNRVRCPGVPYKEIETTPLDYAVEHCRFDHKERFVSPPLEDNRLILFTCAVQCLGSTGYGRLNITYSFKRAFLPQWREIDRRVRRLLDQLIVDPA